MSDEYKGNSRREREAEEKRTDKVIDGGATVVKKSKLRRLVGDDAIGQAGDKLEKYFSQKAADVVCTVVNTIADVICNIANIRITGEPVSKKSSGGGSRVSYRKYYQDDDDDDDKPARVRRAKGRGNYNDIVFWSRGDAEVALDSMEDMLDHYKVVRVADLYDLAGLPCDYNQNKFGWYRDDIEDAFVDSMYVTDPEDGERKKAYYISLPKASAL